MFSKVRELCLSRGMPSTCTGADMLAWIERNVSDRPVNTVADVRNTANEILELCDAHGIDRTRRAAWIKAGITADQVARLILETTRN